MLDNLIMAYRAQIYDWDFCKWIDFVKKNKLLMTAFAGLALLIVISAAICIKFKSSWLILLVLLIECAIIIFMDRYTVKRYQKFLLGKEHHLAQTIVFLKTVLPNQSLFSAEYVDELIERLTKRIQARAPFKNMLTGLTNFTKAIILPAITYVAGVYAGNLGRLNFITVANWTVSIVFLLGIASLALNVAFKMLRAITCRDYDAAIALQEDLMDIKLLHFRCCNA